MNTEYLVKWWAEQNHQMSSIFVVNKFRLYMHKLHMSVGHVNSFRHVVLRLPPTLDSVDAPTTFARRINYFIKSDKKIVL